MSSHEILLYYKYVPLADPEQFKFDHEVLCKKLGLTGRIIIAHEGLNGTVEGTRENTQKYIDTLSQDPRFADINFKRSDGTGKAFPRLSIKVRREIVSLHLDGQDFSPREVTGKYLKPEELHEWIHSEKEFYIVDMRNDYEFNVGHFKNSLFPDLTNFRDLPHMLPKIEHLKNKTVLTVCTGGVRCEKASGFLVKSGFNDVYQLHNGIVSYMEKYPNEDFLGALYVFDGRITMAFNSKDHPHVMIGRCAMCAIPSEHYVNCQNLRCHMHFICCETCIGEGNKPYCSQKCREIADPILVHA